MIHMSYGQLGLAAVVIYVGIWVVRVVIEFVEGRRK